MAGPLQQLDLFGFPIETAAPKPKKERVAKPAAPKPPVETLQVPVAEPAMVYENQNIGVRIKVKKIAEPKESIAIEEKKASKRGRKSFREMDTELDLIDVPEESILAQKLYYSISEVAGWFKVNTSL
ncbi:MAG: hypothetical protein RLY89_2626, partial [Bacteroidota bacterium]